jgi:hypothetical protein
MEKRKISGCESVAQCSAKSCVKCNCKRTLNLLGENTSKVSAVTLCKLELNTME